MRRALHRPIYRDGQVDATLSQLIKALRVELKHSKDVSLNASLRCAFVVAVLQYDMNLLGQLLTLRILLAAV